MKTSQNILITGCSTGIGKACALHLDRKGYRVFAGVRKKKDAESLRSCASDRLHPLLLDVTDSESISGALDETKSRLNGQGLHGLVNNAGVAVSAPMECIPMDEFKKILNVNVTGQLEVTQAFLPLLRKARGAIVFMGSESGRFTLPMVGAYSASKHALEAVANALRAELIPSGVSVSTIEPASIKTEIWAKTIEQGERLVQSLPEVHRRTYENELAASLRMSEILSRKGISERHVVKAVSRALQARKPKARYVVGAEAWIFIAWYTLAPLNVSAWLAHKVLRLLGTKKSFNKT